LASKEKKKFNCKIRGVTIAEHKYQLCAPNLTHVIYSGIVESPGGTITYLHTKRLDVVDPGITK
jgi:hypothetical protein